MKRLLIVALIATPALGAVPTTCDQGGDYARALCAYQTRDFTAAEKGFRAIVEADAPDPGTIRSLYFLARTLMKTGRFDEAAKIFMRIYSLDKPFYDGWSCDFLLGECRKASGK